MQLDKKAVYNRATDISIPSRCSTLPPVLKVLILHVFKNV